MELTIIWQIRRGQWAIYPTALPKETFKNYRGLWRVFPSLNCAIFVLKENFKKRINDNMELTIIW